MTNTEFIAGILPAVQDAMLRFGILASATIAQACLESGYGTSELAAKAKNLFGMKTSLSGNTWTSIWNPESSYTCRTNEQAGSTMIRVDAEFRAYPGWEDSVTDHCMYLAGAMNGANPRYDGITTEKNYKKAIQIIADGGYATDSSYADKLCSIVETYNLTQYDDENSGLVIQKLLTTQNLKEGTIGRVKYLVVHYVGETGGAKANCEYYASKELGASAHYFVGFDGEIWQSVEDWNIAWHCGAKTYKHPECRNANSIGVELCVRNKGDKSDTSRDWYFEDATVEAAQKLVRYLMDKYDIPEDHVIRHYDVTGKICPNPYVYNHTAHTWEAFQAAISAGDGETKLSGWQQDDAGWKFYLGNTGECVKNDWYQDNGKWYWFNGSGYMVHDTWYLYHEKWYYMGSDGAMVKGLQSVDGKWYYLDEDGEMVTEPVTLTPDQDGALQYPGLANR